MAKKTYKDESSIRIDTKENINLIFDKDGRLILIKADRFKFDNPVHCRMRLLKNYEINLILDAGANIGQYAQNVRSMGYKGRIVSFEPLSSAFTELKNNTDKDPLWEAVNIALGDTDSKKSINISANSRSSSILEMLPLHLNNSPQSKYKGKEIVFVKTLDSIFNKYVKPKDRAFLKIDTQGYEKKIIDGAKKSLKNILGIQMELSLAPLYKGEVIFIDMLNLMGKKGYALASLEPGWSISNGRLLQTDVIFFKKEII